MRTWSGWAFIPWHGDDSGLTWLPPPRYSRVSWMLTRPWFFLLPSRQGLRGHPNKVLKDVSHRRTSGPAFSAGGLWNTELSSRLPSLQLLQPMFSRKGWRKFRQKSFPISPIDWAIPTQILHPPPHLHTTQKQFLYIYLNQIPVLSMCFLQAHCGLLFTIITHLYNLELDNTVTVVIKRQYTLGEVSKNRADMLNLSSRNNFIRTFLPKCQK